MLKSLQIRNFALAENLQIEFLPGLNIITGETGTGKSILVGAISALLGGRVYTEVVRTGADRALVEAVLDVRKLPRLRKFLDERGIDADEELFIRREISVKSSSRAFINDSPVTISTLAELGNYLIDVHGQHEHQSLLRKETHRHFLDALGQSEQYLQNTAKAFRAVRDIQKELKGLAEKQAELSSQAELHRFQLQEIVAAELQADEEEGLLDEKKVLGNMEKLFSLSAQLSALFDGEDHQILADIASAEERLKELGNFSKEMEKLSGEFSSARIIIEETARSVEGYQSQLEFDPQRLEVVEARLNEINQLKKKYGATIADILAYQGEIEKQLSLQENFEVEIEKLNESLNAALDKYREEAQALSNHRQTIATGMEKKVQELLALVGMPNMRFQASLTRQEAAEGVFREGEKRYTGDENGVDLVEFFISPNPGEDFKSLSKIASGGEMSRIMLALKSILAEIDEVPTLVFDEIDAGISGRIAQAVGRNIYKLSKSHQILCITHLPQIASYGESHFVVEKFVEDGRTFTSITPLEADRRVEEVARLMAGENISNTVLDSARQLIEEGRNGK